MQHEQTIQVLGPKDYGNPEQEFEQLKESAGMVIHHDCEWITITGPDAGDFLHRMLTRSIRDQSLGSTRHAWLLNASGRIICAISILHYAQQSFALAVRKGFAETVMAALDRYVIMEDLKLEYQQTWYSIAVEGHQLPQDITPAEADPIHQMQRTYSGASGLTYFGEAEAITKWQQYLQAKALIPIGYQALDLMRQLTRTPAFLSDIQVQTNPLIYGNELGYIDYGKGCYIGQETVAMTRDRGRPPSRLIQVEGDLFPAANSDLYLQGKAVGHLCSHAFNPLTKKTLAFAIVKHGSLENGHDTFYDADSRAWQVRYITQYKAE